MNAEQTSNLIIGLRCCELFNLRGGCSMDEHTVGQERSGGRKSKSIERMVGWNEIKLYVVSDLLAIIAFATRESDSHSLVGIP